MKRSILFSSSYILGLLLLLSSCAAPTTIVPIPAATIAQSPTAVPAASTATPIKMPMGPGVEWHLVVINESSGWGLGSANATQIEHDLGIKVRVEDFALGDLSAREVLDALQTGKSFRARLEELPAALKGADVVVMSGNPMNSVDAATAQKINNCFASIAPAPCAPENFEGYVNDLKAIWAKVFALRAGQPTILRAIDAASPFVGDWKETKTFDACTVCWQCVSNANRQAATAYGIPFLSRYDAFNGAMHDEDLGKKGYLGIDGIHPNDRARELTAELLSKLGYDPVPPPR